MEIVEVMVVVAVMVAGLRGIVTSVAGRVTGRKTAM